MTKQCRAAEYRLHDHSCAYHCTVACREYLEKEVADVPVTRPIYLLGESMGCIAALAVACERPDLVDRVVIVNPATSYPRSLAARLAPILPRLNKV